LPDIDQITFSPSQEFLPWDYDALFPFSELHCVLFIGIAEVVVGLIKMKCYDTNDEDFLGGRPPA